MYISKREEAEDIQLKGLERLYAGIAALGQAKADLHRRERRGEYSAAVKVDIKRIVRECQELASKYLRT